MGAPPEPTDLPPIDRAAAAAAHHRWSTLTKPEGSLGRLEELGERLASIQGSARPRFRHKAITVFVADHGVAGEGVSAYPSSVTAAMLENFLAGGAAINVLARLASADVVFVDVGIDADPRPEEGRLRVRRIARGTRNFAHEAAMTSDQATRSVAIGRATAASVIEAGADLLAIGDMGIGNTTSASAMLAALTGRPGAEVVGPGTGLDPAGVARKAGLVDAALRDRAIDPGDPWSVLREVGGFEIAAMAGAALGAAARRVPVILDGFIATVAAVWAASVEPRLPAFLVPSHRSAEPGHRLALERLGLVPYLDLGLRLGEGTGAALQMLLCEAATRLLDEMATFEEARVAGRVEGR